MNVAPRVVCFLASPRTGSTQLGRVVASFDRVDGYGEIFHPHAAYSLRPRLARLSERAGITLPDDVTDQKTIDFVRGNPHEVVETLLESAGPDHVVAFKVFSFHLTTALLKSQILQRDDVLPVLLRRRVIDCHISELKAEHNRLWRDSDTTDLAIEADIGRFEKWAKVQRRWYDWCDETLTTLDLPRHLMTYETDIEPGEERTADVLAGIFSAHGLDVGRDRGPVESMKKQDRSTDPADKVSNWATFEAKLERRGLRDLAMGYFI